MPREPRTRAGVCISVFTLAVNCAANQNNKRNPSRAARVLPSPLARPGESERSQANTCGLPITNRGKPGLRAGDLVAVQGIGGLGHLGVQFAWHMGFHTVAIGWGREKEKLAKDLGARLYRYCRRRCLSLAKIKNTSRINNIRRGCVTCYIMDDVQTTRGFGE